MIVSLCFLNQTIKNIFIPICNCVKFIPVTGFSPLLVLWFGIDNTMKIMFLICATLFYFLPTLMQIFDNTEQNIIETATTLGLSRFKILIHVIIPANLYDILIELINMFGVGWTYITLVEAINCSSGLGYYINIGSVRGKTDIVFMSMIIIMIISKLTNTYGHKLLKKLFKYKNL